MYHCQQVTLVNPAYALNQTMALQCKNMHSPVIITKVAIVILVVIINVIHSVVRITRGIRKIWWIKAIEVIIDITSCLPVYPIEVPLHGSLTRQNCGSLDHAQSNRHEVSVTIHKANKKES